MKLHPGLSSYPSIDRFKRLQQRSGCSAAFNKPYLFPTLTSKFLKAALQSVFKKQHNPHPYFYFSPFKLVNLKLNCPKKKKKNLDRNIKCSSVSARAHHPSCCVLLSSDERQPPYVRQGRGPCGNAQYIQFSTAQLFHTFQNVDIMHKKIKIPHFWEFF